MRAAVFYGDHDLRVEDVEAPSGALGPHEALIDVALCGICGTDLHEFEGGPIVTSPEPHPLTGCELPQILGHEIAGTVLDVGSDVTGAAPGDRVTIMPALWCGECHFCVRGLNTHCVRMAAVGLSWPWGGFAPRAVVLDYQLTKIPDDLDWQSAAVVEPAACAVWAVHRARVEPGAAVLITGAGPIGALVAIACEAAGATDVYVSDPNAARRARIAGVGVTEVLDPGSADVAEVLLERTSGIGVDVAIECSGAAGGLDACLQSTRACGTVAQMGMHMSKPPTDALRITTHSLSLVGAWCYAPRDFDRIVALAASGRLPIEKVVSRQIGLERIVEEGFEALLAPGSDDLKVLVDPRADA